MPGEGHVFDPLFAVIPVQRERQSVFSSAAEMINARAFAAFRTLAARFLDCERIAGYCQISRNMALSSDDMEGVVGVDGPDGAERVGPCADERGLSRVRISGAGVDQHQNDAGENELNGALYFHAGHPEGQPEIDSSTY